MYNGLSFWREERQAVNIRVWDDRTGEGHYRADELAAQAGETFPIEDRVPGAEGTAFDLYRLYSGWRKHTGAQVAEPPVYLRVEAADGFEAVIPWGQLGRAALVFEQHGEPLTKGFPLRLYVPDGSSACLNVKSVVHIEFHHDNRAGDVATYGFKNRISPEDLKKM